eukprot:4145214-Pleurochrysis_carterae.AAC.1
MHDLPCWTRVACILAERSRSALQVLGNPAHDGRPCPLSSLFLELPRRCAQPPRLRLLPDQCIQKVRGLLHGVWH